MRKSYLEMEKVFQNAPKDHFWLACPFSKSLNRRTTLAFQFSMLVAFQIKDRPLAEKDSNGWFVCSVKDLEEKGRKRFFSPALQTRALNQLEEVGYIKRKVIGGPPKRHLWINFDLFTKESDIATKELYDSYDEECQRILAS